MANTSPTDRYRYAVASIAESGGGQVFAMRPAPEGKTIDTPYVLDVDAATNAAIEYQVGQHLVSPNYASDTVCIVGVIVGSGHEAELSTVNKNVSTPLRRFDPGILLIAVAGRDASPSTVPQEDVLMYKPAEVAATKRKRWWKFGGRG